MQEIVWNKKCLQQVRNFPVEIRREVGYLFFKLQLGETISMPHSRPMPSIGNGCHELRVRGVDGSYRVFYLLKLRDKIVVFHAFKKKTERTQKSDLEIGKRHLKEMLNEKI